mgnify:CR=1 FL=1
MKASGSDIALEGHPGKRERLGPKALTRKDLRHLRPALHLAKALGALLGPRPVLQPALSRRGTAPGLMAVMGRRERGASPARGR